MALVGVATALVVTVYTGWWAVPGLVDLHRDDPIELTAWLVAGTAVVLAGWVVIALPSVAAFVVRLRWVRLAGAPRRGRRGPAPARPTALWTLEPDPGADGRLRLLRDGTDVAGIAGISADFGDPARVRFRDEVRELEARPGGRGTVVIVDRHTRSPAGSVTAICLAGFGFHRADVGGSMLLAPPGPRRAAWPLLDGDGTQRTLRFEPEGLHVELAADLPPAPLAAALWYLARGVRSVREDRACLRTGPAVSRSVPVRRSPS